VNFRPFVSVVVCVSRNPLILRGCLQSLILQTYPNNLYEIVLVDATPEGAVERLFSNNAVRCVKHKLASRGAMLNAGLKAAKGDIVTITDADCVVDANWLSNLIDGFSNLQVDGVGGNVIINGKPSFDLISNRKTDSEGYVTLNQDTIISLKGPLQIPHFLGANCAFRKSVLEEIGGFLETPKDIGAEDVEICLRLLIKGHKLRFVDAMVFHPVRSLKERIRNAIRDGRSLYFVLRLHRPNMLKKASLRLIKNVFRTRGAILMLFGFAHEAVKEKIL